MKRKKVLKHYFFSTKRKKAFMQSLETLSCLEDHEVIHGEFEVANFASFSHFQSFLYHYGKMKSKLTH